MRPFPPPVSVFILARNEEVKIGAALESVDWAGEVVVIDSYSTDGTVRIALAYGARVVPLSFTRFGELRQAGITHTKLPWIFSLDADERCTPAVRDEILRIVADPNADDAYLVPRRNIFLGREIRHSGWYPDYRQPQLFRRGKMDYCVEDHVHEGYLLMSGRLGRLKNPVHQIPYRTLSEAIQKMDRYTTLNVAKAEGRRPAPFPVAVLRAGWAFFKAYVLQLGFLDGAAGFTIALLRFENSYYKHLKRREAREKPAAKAP